jgi:transcriptional regulator with AAA-type ATPase domain
LIPTPRNAISSLVLTLGRYRILHRIASGGMAEVYRAVAVGERGFQKEVVLKRIRPELALDPRFGELLLEEARLAATLSHANIVQLFELSVVEVRLPPLRERPEDVPLLVRHFLDEAAQAGGGARYELGPRTLAKLQRHRWPGNVRELRNFVVRSVSLAEGQVIDGTLGGVEAPAPAAAPAAALFAMPFKEAKRLYAEPFERDYLEALLARTGGNVSKAAREADLDRAYLTQLLKKYDLK